MENKRNGTADIFKSIFGTLSGGLSVFSNNPFRRTNAQDEKPQQPSDSRGDQKFGDDNTTRESSKLGLNIETESSLPRTRKVKRPEGISETVLDQVEVKKIIEVKKLKPASRARDVENAEAAAAASKTYGDSPIKGKGKVHRKREKGSEFDISESYKRYPEIAETRKKARVAKDSGSLGDKIFSEENIPERCREKQVAEEGEVNLRSKKKRKPQVSPADGGERKKTVLPADGVIVDDKSHREQGSEYEPATPDGSEEASLKLKRKSKKEKNSQDGMVQTEVRKRKKGSKVDSLEEHNDMDVTQVRKRKKGSKVESLEEHNEMDVVGENVDNQKQVTDDKQMKLKSGAKRKREDDIEDRYEKKIRGSDSPAIVSETLDSKENKQGKQDTGKAEGHDVLSKKRKRSEDEQRGDMSKRTFDGEEKLKRTIFVGNLPLKIKKKAIIKEFSQYGVVESLRLRSVPLLDTKIPRKGAIIKGKINEAVNSQHAYVVFEEEVSANAALAHNMKELNGNHLRVDAAHVPRGAFKGSSPLSYDRGRSIFVGNVPFDVKDEELYQVFSAEKNPEMDVEAIRVVRDPQTSLSKGIAFVLFKTKAGASRALSKRVVKLRDRILRVSRVQAAQTEQKKLRPAKRGRESEIEEGVGQRKRAKLSAAYEGTRATKADGRPGKWTPSKPFNRKDQSRSSKDSSSSFGASRPYTKWPANGAKKGQDQSMGSAQKFSGLKRKRAEKHQRGSSRSKKIRRG